MWHNLAQLLKYRGLIQSLVARELKARYRGSVLGVFWSFGNPLLLLLIYTAVFKYFVPRGNDTVNLQPYALFLFCGLLPWTWFASSLNESAMSLVSGGNLIKKVLFPAEVLPIVTVLANLVHFLLGLPILAAFIVFYMVAPQEAAAGSTPINVALHFGELIWLPVVIFVQLLLTFWFFATPIIYWWNNVPGLKVFLDFNPFTHLAVSYQEILFFPENAFGHKWWLLALGGASIVVFLAGYWLFDRLRDSFAEVV